MRIAIDVSQIVYGTGVSVYTRNLVENLLKIDSRNEYILFAGSLRRRKDVFDVFPQAKVFPIPPTVSDIVWNRLHVLPIEKLIGKVDVFHSSDWTEPPAGAFKVTTIHDVIPLKFPEKTPKIIFETHERKLRWVALESKRIIVPSQSTKNDLVEFGFREGIIRVTPEGPSLDKADEAEVQRVKKKYGIHGDYLFAIGTKPWKNIARIIDAYHLSKFGKNLKLLVAGERKGSELSHERGVRFLGHVVAGDLSPLLTGSSCLVFASTYEGFGVPILDAFNCSVPVVTSNVSSMPEVAGDAAVLVDPYDVNSIAEGIKKALGAPKTYVSLGLRRIKDFSWEKTAKLTLDIYNEAKI